MWLIVDPPLPDPFSRGDCDVAKDAICGAIEQAVILVYSKSGEGGIPNRVIPAKGGFPKTQIRQLVPDAAKPIIFTNILARLTS